MAMSETAHEICTLTDDAFLGGRLTLLQPATGYRAGLDAVVLAASVRGDAAAGSRVLDLGAGVGVVGLCIAVRHPAARVTLLEREPVLAGLALKNIHRNGLGGRVEVVTADLEAAAAQLERAGLPADSFDHVFANPPFQIEGQGKPPADRLRAAAHVMPHGGIELWVRVMARVTRPGGIATVIHRTDALLEVLKAFDGRFGGIEVTPICPRDGDPAVRILVQGIKGSRAPLRVMGRLTGVDIHEAAVM